MAESKLNLLLTICDGDGDPGDGDGSGDDDDGGDGNGLAVNGDMAAPVSMVRRDCDSFVDAESDNCRIWAKFVESSMFERLL